MSADFTVGGVGSDSFGARLLSGYKVGSTPVDRSRLKASLVQGWIPLSTKYGLRAIYLPVYITADTPRAAAEAKSRLDAAMLADPVELTLPNGMTYTASIESVGDAAEVTLDGREIKCDYTLAGYAHDPLQTITSLRGSSISVSGTAPEMDCRLTCTVEAKASKFEMAGVIWSNVVAGDVLVLDGIKKLVTRNGVNDITSTDLTEWPKLKPGKNSLYSAVKLQIEYYPIWI